MKQKDMALIAVAIFISGMASYFISNWMFAKPKDREQKVEVVQSISADFPTPDSKYFNSNALDPTQLIQIGDSTNTTPFNGEN